MGINALVLLVMNLELQYVEYLELLSQFPLTLALHAALWNCGFLIKILLYCAKFYSHQQAWCDTAMNVTGFHHPLSKCMLTLPNDSPMKMPEHHPIFENSSVCACPPCDMDHNAA